jgi:hypothetical protein
MKKMKIIFILMGLISILIGCASREPYEETLSIHSHLSYDWNLMTFTNTSSKDILYQAGNSYDDFIILHQEISLESLSINQKIALRNLFDQLDELSLQSNVKLGEILSYSSIELKQAMDTHEMTLTLDHVIVFNQLKSDIDLLKQIMESNTFHLSKVNYIEKRLSVTLSDEDIEGLVLLQSVYEELVNIQSDIRIYEKSFHELIVLFESIGYIANQEDVVVLENAYQKIMSLHQR